MQNARVARAIALANLRESGISLALDDLAAEDILTLGALAEHQALKALQEKD